MKGLLAVAGAHKGATALVVGAVLVGGGVVNAATDGTTTATVEKVVDGDTIDVEYDGDTHRVRLLNVNTPESVDPDKPVECLGPEASAWLEQRLPVGTEVRLERDQETEDGYGRELAAVFVGDELVNAEIARAGLGVAMSVGANTKYLPPVRAAQSEAQAAGRGLYATAPECTVPARVEQLEAAATGALAQEPASDAALGEFDAYAAKLAAVATLATTAAGVLDGDATAFPLVAHEGQAADFRSRVQVVQNRVDSATSLNSTARKARKRQLEAEAQRAAEQAAREEAARQAAEAEAERAAAEAAAQATRRPSSSGGSSSGGSSARRSSSSGSSSGGSSSGGSSSGGSSGSVATRTAAPTTSSSGSGSGGGSGYTGCRSYAPGGKTWTPIPC